MRIQMRSTYQVVVSFMNKAAVSAFLGTMLCATQAFARPVTVESTAARATFMLNGEYQVRYREARWVLKGKLNEKLESITRKSGMDKLGRWREVDAQTKTQMATIRVYASEPVVLFRDERLTEGKNSEVFPVFEALPSGLMKFSYGVSAFAKYEFGRLGAEGPWVLFDKKEQAMVLSPADHFLVADMASGTGGVDVGGIDPKIAILPAGFEHGTLLVLGKGIGATLKDWGQVLQTMNGKHPVPNDADVLLNKFGYWTDHFATYYYKDVPKLGYEGTLLAIRDAYKKLGVPIAYMQLDSWWYPKEKGNTTAGMAMNGETVYRADPTVFPKGLRAFHEQMGLPFVVHARWVAPNSPYRHEYRMSRNVILSPKFWDTTAKYLHEGGVAVYEQDWLNKNARPAINLTAPRQFLGNMAHAMSSQHIDIQYCMPLPGDFMASTRYQNLQTIRVSDDGFTRARWNSFLYTSALARSVGLWPWSDVYMSKQLPELILGTLSAGPVGVGDALGDIDAANLKRVMRADSVLLKPDTSILPVDEMYISDAEHLQKPMIAATHSGDEVEVFSYPRKPDETQTTVSPLHDLGVPGAVYAYDWVHRSGRLIPSGGAFTMKFDHGWAYTVLAPVNVDGIALLGDVNAIVPLAQKRFSALANYGSTSLTVTFAVGEDAIPITGYAERRPVVVVKHGKVGTVDYDPTSHVFRFVVYPASKTPTVRKASIRIQ